MARLLKRKLYKFQRLIAKFAYDLGAAGLFMDMGTGKTITALAIVARLWRRKGIRLVLIGCPKSVVSVWHRQIALHLAIRYRIYDARDVLGHATTRRELKRRDDDVICFLAVNYERLWRVYHILKKIPWDVVISDESHRLARRNSRQSRVLGNIGKKAKYRFALTGTPTVNSELDLWAQFRFIKPDLFGTNWAKFERKYTRKTGYMGYKRKLKQHRRKLYFKKMKPYVFYISQDDALDLPPEIDTIIDFELIGKARKAYNELESQFYTEVAGLEVLSRLQITTMLKLQQLTGGHIIIDEETVVRLEQTKLITMLDFLKDLPKEKKLVIFARFTEEVDIITEAIPKALGRTVMKFDGRTKDRGIWQEFQDQEDPNTFVTQIAVGGVGIELFAADIAVFYSRDYSYVNYVQARKRLNRDGQKSKHVRFISMLGKKTIDEDNDHSLQHKGEAANDVLAHFKGRISSMAKKDKKDKGSKGKKKPTPPILVKPDYGVDQVAEILGIGSFTVRQKLRAAGIEKEGRVYDFGSAKKAKEVAAQIKSSKGGGKKKSKKKGKKDKDE